MRGYTDDILQSSIAKIEMMVLPTLDNLSVTIFILWDMLKENARCDLMRGGQTSCSSQGKGKINPSALETRGEAGCPHRCC